VPTTGPSTRVALAAAALMLSAWMTACSASPAQHASPTTSKTGSATAAPTTTPTPVPTRRPPRPSPPPGPSTTRTLSARASPPPHPPSPPWRQPGAPTWTGPSGPADRRRGNVIVATENDTLYSLNPASGTVVWQDHVGTPVPRADPPLRQYLPARHDRHPRLRPATQSIFVVAEETGPIHVLYDFDAISGAVLWSRQVDISNSLEHPSAVQQRPALTGRQWLRLRRFRRPGRRLQPVRGSGGGGAHQQPGRKPSTSWCPPAGRGPSGRPAARWSGPTATSSSPPATAPPRAGPGTRATRCSS